MIKVTIEEKTNKEDSLLDICIISKLIIFKHINTASLTLPPVAHFSTISSLGDQNFALSPDDCCNATTNLKPVDYAPPIESFFNHHSPAAEGRLGNQMAPPPQCVDVSRRIMVDSGFSRKYVYSIVLIFWKNNIIPLVEVPSTNHFASAAVLQQTTTAMLAPPVTSSSHHQISVHDRFKLERKRERNRAAATKCRRRKLERIANLQARVDQIQQRSTALRAALAQALDDVTALHDLLEEHRARGCSFQAVGDGGCTWNHWRVSVLIIGYIYALFETSFDIKFEWYYRLFKIVKFN